jgi:cytoskeletal protein CcmA (bactofilin family)
MKLTASSGSDGEAPYLNAEVNLKGSIKFRDNLIFAGRIEGELVSAEGTLIVAENAVVRGNVTSKIVIVEGKVHGNINGLERCELRSRSQLIGDLRSPRLMIEEGATFVGRSEVIPGKAVLWC